MAKYQIEFSGSDPRNVRVDDAPFSNDPISQALGGIILTDSLVQDIADLIASQTSRTINTIWRIDGANEI